MAQQRVCFDILVNLYRLTLGLALKLNNIKSFYYHLRSWLFTGSINPTNSKHRLYKTNQSMCLLWAGNAPHKGLQVFQLGGFSTRGH